MSDCTVTIFGRPLAQMSVGDANCARSFIADLDDCDECQRVKDRRASYAPAREN